MTCVKARALNQQAAVYEALHCYVLSRLCSKIFFPKRRDYLSSVWHELSAFLLRLENRNRLSGSAPELINRTSHS